MAQMTSSLDTPLGIAKSNLTETDRKTVIVERAYLDARAAFVAAATALQEHGARFAQRDAELKALGGTHSFTAPMPVDLVLTEGTGREGGV